MSGRDVFLDKVDVMELIMTLSNWNGVIPEPAVMIPVKGRPGMIQYDACPSVQVQ